MKSKNRLTALLLGGAMVLSLLAGCAGTPVNDGAPAAAPNGPQGQARQEAEAQIPEGALVIAKQGIFSAGGITVTSEGTFDPENHFEETGAGQTAHVDHANVLYQIPAEETSLPMVFLHGYGQSRMGWMTTPDGRPGWSDLFLRMGHSVFLIDGPRRGEAGATSVSGEISTKTLDQRWYTQFRIGRWENGKSVPNEGSQFPNDDESVNQFFRQMTPDTGMRSDMGGDFDNETVARAAAAAIDEVYARTGRDSILVTHSQGGGTVHRPHCRHRGRGTRRRARGGFPRFSGGAGEEDPRHHVLRRLHRQRRSGHYGDHDVAGDAERVLRLPGRL